MNRLLLVPIFFVFFSCSESNTEQVDTPQQSKQSKVDDWSCKAIFVDDQGWGYQLFRGSHLEIDQKNIPSVNGLHYFQSEEKALLAAELALEKIDQGLFPPSVNPKELDSIGAIHLDSLVKATDAMMRKNVN